MTTRTHTSGLNKLQQLREECDFCLPTHKVWNFSRVESGVKTSRRQITFRKTTCLLHVSCTACHIANINHTFHHLSISSQSPSQVQSVRNCDVCAIQLPETTWKSNCASRYLFSLGFCRWRSFLRQSIWATVENILKIRILIFQGNKLWVYTVCGGTG